MAKRKKQTVSFDVQQHSLVPKHEKVKDKDKEALLESLNITVSELPAILITDPAIQSLNPKVGDIIKISRPSVTAGEAVFYRGVISV